MYNIEYTMNGKRRFYCLCAMPRSEAVKWLLTFAARYGVASNPHLVRVS